MAWSANFEKTPKPLLFRVYCLYPDCIPILDCQFPVKFWGMVGVGWGYPLFLEPSSHLSMCEELRASPCFKSRQKGRPHGLVGLVPMSTWIGTPKSPDVCNPTNNPQVTPLFQGFQTFPNDSSIIGFATFMNFYIAFVCFCVRMSPFGT